MKVRYQNMIKLKSNIQPINITYKVTDVPTTEKTTNFSIIIQLQKCKRILITSMTHLKCFFI